MIQKVVPVGPFQCNCQILVCPTTHEAVIVDPGEEPKKILAALGEIESQINQKIKVKALFHTHAHFDHIGATRAVKESLIASGAADPKIFLHKGDEFIYQMLPKQAAMFGGTAETPLPINHFLEDNERLAVGSLKFTILHTPGHSPGGVCFHLHSDSKLKIPEMVFTGDSLFRRSIGRTDLWGANQDDLLKSIKNRVFTLDDDTCAWPGHGLKTTVGEEKRENPFLT